MWPKWLRKKRRIKLPLVKKEYIESLPNDIYGLPAFYGFTKDGIKIWPKPDKKDINLYWNLNE